MINSKTSPSNLIGTKVTIKSGSTVRHDLQGIPCYTQISTRNSTVTVKKAESDHGKTRVYWKSNGIIVSSLI